MRVKNALAASAALLLALAATARGALALADLPHVAVPRATPDLDPSAAAWSQAAAVELPWNVVHARPASEPARAAIATDGKALFVRFDVTQHEPIAATAHTNDVGQGSDDAVWIDMWPAGTAGYFYQFQATPNGTHYQSSSENTGFAPTWESHGTTTASGYTVTMKIPLDVLRGAAADKPWKVQFVRYVHATGEMQLWSYDAAQTQPDDVTRAGSMTMPLVSTAPARPKPRIASYALAEAASKTIGGSTSRVGADLSIPIAPTASFYATFHPDYSNVELDQQTILPTVSARFYNEVRPFFTQGASFYNQFNCVACSGPLQELYTPAIPTPREGYAIEGKQGPLSFASFDSIGDGRSDNASALGFTSTDQRWNGEVQRVSSNTQPFVDDVTTAGLTYSDLKQIQLSAAYGSDSGTNVLVPNQAQRYEFDGSWANQTFGIFGGVRKIGEYYNPADGFVWHPGVAGYSLFSAKIWDFSAASKIASAGAGAFIDRYQGPQQGIAQSDNGLFFDLLTKSAWDIQINTGSNYWRFDGPGGTGILTPISNTGGFQITYHSGLQTNNPGNFPNHGASATPTILGFNTGRYGDGRLDTWLRSTTIAIGTRSTLTLALDDTAQYFTKGTNNVQWFESASYAYQLGVNSSFAIGLRRVVGTPPNPNGGGNCVGTCSNVSIAYHLRRNHAEYYLAYGDPNALTTTPQAIFKIIFYAGAEKGT